jgi:hypothetical protein
MATPTHDKIEWMRIKNDINGNPRYVCHFFNLLTNDEKHKDYADGALSGIDAAANSLDNQYKLALKRAKTIGGHKFHNKQFGGGIVFQSHNINDTEKHINDLLLLATA